MIAGCRISSTSKRFTNEAARSDATRGLHQAQAAGRPRHRRPGRQDGRPWHQGPARPRTVRSASRAASCPHAANPQLKGFTNPFRVEYTPVNLDALAALERDEFTLGDAGRRRPRARKKDLVKVLGPGRAAGPDPGHRPRLLGVGPGRDRPPRGVRRRSRSPSDRSTTGPGQRPETPRTSANGPPLGRMKTMISRLGNIFRLPDLRNKVLFTIVVIGLYRPAPTSRSPG